MRAISTILAWLVMSFSALAFSIIGEARRSDGTSEDTQAAILAAPHNGTVIIPKGNFTWFESVSVVGKAIRLRAASPGGTVITNSVPDGAALILEKAQYGNVEITGLKFVFGAPATNNTFLIQARGHWSHAPILLHNCEFVTGANSFQSYAIEWKCNGGVIWSNKFHTSAYPIVNGISLVVPGYEWTNNSTMGTNDINGTFNTYIEDNLFLLGYNACVNPDDNSRVVFRYNTCSNATVSPHGADTSAHGVRHLEVYGNNFIYDAATDPLTGMNYWCFIRGGTGVICSNSMPDVPWGKEEVILTVQNIRRNGGPYACWTTYPVPRQIGQGWLNGSFITEPYYVWGNTGGANGNVPALRDYNADDCNNGLSVTTFVIRDRDYILSFKPGWRAYPYPHPLRVAENIRISGAVRVSGAVRIN